MAVAKYHTSGLKYQWLGQNMVLNLRFATKPCWLEFRTKKFFLFCHETNLGHLCREVIHCNAMQCIVRLLASRWHGRPYFSLGSNDYVNISEISMKICKYIDPIAHGFQLELLHTLPKGKDMEVYISYSHGTWHVTQHLISICEMETAKSDIFSISDILFSWTKKRVWRI